MATPNPSESQLESLKQAEASVRAQLAEAEANLKTKAEQLKELEEKVAANSSRMRSVSKVLKDIDIIKPLYEKARSKVESIDRNRLLEIASYPNPPENIKKTIEAVLFLLYGRKIDWKDSKVEMAGTQFIDNIIKFKPESLTEERIALIRQNYVNSSWKLKAIYKASSAVGPLAEWLEAQLTYREVQSKLAPLSGELEELKRRDRLVSDARQEINEYSHGLEEEASALRMRLAKIEQLIAQLRAGSPVSAKELDSSEVADVLTMSLIENLGKALPKEDPISRLSAVFEREDNEVEEEKAEEPEVEDSPDVEEDDSELRTAKKKVASNLKVLRESGIHYKSLIVPQNAHKVSQNFTSDQLLNIPESTPQSERATEASRLVEAAVESTIRRLTPIDPPPAIQEEANKNEEIKEPNKGGSIEGNTERNTLGSVEGDKKRGSFGPGAGMEIAFGRKSIPLRPSLIDRASLESLDPLQPGERRSSHSPTAAKNTVPIDTEPKTEKIAEIAEEEEGSRTKLTEPSRKTLEGEPRTQEPSFKNIDEPTKEAEQSSVNRESFLARELARNPIVRRASMTPERRNTTPNQKNVFQDSAAEKETDRSPPRRAPTAPPEITIPPRDSLLHPKKDQDDSSVKLLPETRETSHRILDEEPTPANRASLLAAELSKNPLIRKHSLSPAPKPRNSETRPSIPSNDPPAPPVESKDPPKTPGPLVEEPQKPVQKSEPAPPTKSDLPPSPPDTPSSSDRKVRLLSDPTAPAPIRTTAGGGIGPDGFLRPSMIGRAVVNNVEVRQIFSPAQSVATASFSQLNEASRPVVVPVQPVFTQPALNQPTSLSTVMTPTLLSTIHSETSPSKTVLPPPQNHIARTIPKSSWTPQAVSQTTTQTTPTFLTPVPNPNQIPQKIVSNPPTQSTNQGSVNLITQDINAGIKRASSPIQSHPQIQITSRPLIQNTTTVFANGSQPNTQIISQGIPQGVPLGVLQGVSQGVSQEITQVISNGIPQGVPQGVPQGIPQGIPQMVRQMSPIYSTTQRGVSPQPRPGMNPTFVQSFGPAPSGLSSVNKQLESTSLAQSQRNVGADGKVLVLVKREDNKNVYRYAEDLQK